MFLDWFLAWSAAFSAAAFCATVCSRVDIRWSSVFCVSGTAPTIYCVMPGIPIAFVGFANAVGTPRAAMNVLSQVSRRDTALRCLGLIVTYTVEAARDVDPLALACVCDCVALVMLQAHKKVSIKNLETMNMRWWLWVALMVCVFLVMLSVRRAVQWNADTELVIVSAHYNEDLNWLLDSEYPVVVCDKPGAASMPFEPDPVCSLPVNRGREASSYLKFIVENYDHLPRFVAFLHGHERAHHQLLPFPLLEAIQRAKKNDYHYISLNATISSKRIQDGHPGHAALQKYWDSHFRDIFNGIDFPEHLWFMCCAQFIVSRAAIRRHPRAVYQRLYNLVMDPSNGDEFDLACAIEFVWHMLFGESPDMCSDKGSDCSIEHCMNDESCTDGPKTQSAYVASRFYM